MVDSDINLDIDSLNKDIETVFDNFSHVFFKRNTPLLVKAEHICRTPLKLCRQRHMSATAVHFSITAIRAAKFCRRMTSEATSRDTFPKEYQVGLDYSLKM